MTGAADHGDLTVGSGAGMSQPGGHDFREGINQLLAMGCPGGMGPQGPCFDSEKFSEGDATESHYWPALVGVGEMSS